MTAAPCAARVELCVLRSHQAVYSSLCLRLGLYPEPKSGCCVLWCGFMAVGVEVSWVYVCWAAPVEVCWAARFGVCWTVYADGTGCCIAANTSRDRKFLWGPCRHCQWCTLKRGCMLETGAAMRTACGSSGSVLCLGRRLSSQVGLAMRPFLPLLTRRYVPAGYLGSCFGSCLGPCFSCWVVGCEASVTNHL